MTKYGYDIIECDNLTTKFLSQFNLAQYTKDDKKLIIQVKNTKSINLKELEKIIRVQQKYNINMQISVIGPYADDPKLNPNTSERYFYNTLYSLEEIYKIVSKFESIETIIDPSWNQYDIVIFLIDLLTRNIMYDPEYLLMKEKGKSIPKVIGIQDESDYYDRSLRGILTRKTVCAGFAVIFKELANRNGIQCKYVNGGSYDDRGNYRGGHAWNLVKINGVIHPIDVTWKNTKYRKGDFTSIEDICCDVEKFKKRHHPKDNRDNENLVKMDENIARASRKKTGIRKHYNFTTYTCTRKDKSKFVVSQIGTYKGVYRYLYAEVNSDGSYGTPKIYFSNTNITKEVQEHKFENNDHYDEFTHSTINVLFSKENLKDSENRNTLYIGSCELENNKFVEKVSDIKKEDRAVKAFSLDNIKSKKRQDGSSVTVVQIPNKTHSNGMKYEYFIYVLSKGPRVLEYNVYSNDNYFEMNSEYVVNKLLSDDKLVESMTNNGILKGIN